MVDTVKHNPLLKLRSLSINNYIRGILPDVFTPTLPLEDRPRCQDPIRIISNTKKFDKVIVCIKGLLDTTVMISASYPSEKL